MRGGNELVASLRAGVEVRTKSQLAEGPAAAIPIETIQAGENDLVEAISVEVPQEQGIDKQETAVRRDHFLDDLFKGRWAVAFEDIELGDPDATR